MTTASPNQQGVEGTECEEAWMITVESIILFTYASFVRNRFILPHQEGIFLGWLATDYTSLRNSWAVQDMIIDIHNRMDEETFMTQWRTFAGDRPLIAKAEQEETVDIDKNKAPAAE